MKRLVKHGRNFMSILTVLVMIVSWFAASNHCALGVAPSESKGSADQCPFHSKPAVPTKQKQSSDMVCCKILRALAPTVAKNLVAKIIFVGRIDFVPLPAIAPRNIGIPIRRLDTGPPGALSFAESVLHRSILAHAPPSLG